MLNGLWQRTKTKNAEFGCSLVRKKSYLRRAQVGHPSKAIGIAQFFCHGIRTTESTICTLCVHKRKKEEEKKSQHFAAADVHIHHTSDILICAVLILQCCLLPSDFQSIHCSSSASQVEAHTVCLACLMVRAHHAMPVETESDNRPIIQLSVAETVPLWELSALILDIRWLASQHQMAFSWTSRMNNKVAHWVAKAQASNSLPISWVVCLLFL
ncbi:hypothetical protein CsSME_00023446 [Camellia sinensis var. sinensis]